MTKAAKKREEFLEFVYQLRLIQERRRAQHDNGRVSYRDRLLRWSVGWLKV